MSRFYASIQGERGEATRQGHRQITGHVRSWEGGVQVEGARQSKGDVFCVYATGGSNGAGSGNVLLGYLYVYEDGRRLWEPNLDANGEL